MCTHQDISYQVSELRSALTYDGKVYFYDVHQVCNECNKRVRVLHVEVPHYEKRIIENHRLNSVGFYE